MKNIRLTYLLILCGILLIVGVCVNSYRVTYLQKRIYTLEQTIGKTEEVAQARREYVIQKIVMCESSGKHEGTWGDGGKSYGIVQFQKRTFDWLSKEAGMEGEWKNEQDQLNLMSWALDNGYGDHWTCYRKLTEVEKWMVISNLS